MSEKRFCGYKKDGSQLILSDKEIVENALEQEKDGVNPPFLACKSMLKVV